MADIQHQVRHSEGDKTSIFLKVWVWIKERTLRSKLVIPLVLTFLIFAGVGGFSLYSIKNITSFVRYNNRMSININNLQGVISVILKSHDQLLALAWSSAFRYDAGKPVTEEWVFDDLKNKQTECSEGIDKFREAAKDDLESEAIAQQLKDADIINNETLKKLTEILKEGKVKREEVFSTMESLKKHTNEIRDIADNLLFTFDQKRQKVSSDLESTAMDQESQIVKLITIGISLATGLFFLVFVIIARVVSSLQEMAQASSSAGNQVSLASNGLSKASEQLSSVSQQQASSLEETSASLTEIAGMAESNIKGAESADDKAKEVYKISEDARNSMDNLASTMGSILESNARIEKLVKVIEEVGEKTQVIDDIVFKTQLLSFNASVEAERAGEHGRGFAVVAQEVGNLAQLSGKAALEISTIVKQSIKEAEVVANENKSRVTEGGKLANETKDKMGMVLERMNDILEDVSKIVQASKEQGQGIGQISTSVESISQLTQESASTAEETASSSYELSAQSKALLDVVSKLIKLVEGKNSADSSKMTAASIAGESKKTTAVLDKKFKVLKGAKTAENKNMPKSSESTIVTAKNGTSSSGDWEKL